MQKKNTQQKQNVAKNTNKAEIQKKKVRQDKKSGDSNKNSYINSRDKERNEFGKKSGNVKRNDFQKENRSICPYASKCGGCDYQGVPYAKQLAEKQKEMEKLLGGFAKVYPIIGMEEPLYYRNKVHAVFDRDRKGNIISGV